MTGRETGCSPAAAVLLGPTRLQEPLFEAAVSGRPLVADLDQVRAASRTALAGHSTPLAATHDGIRPRGLFVEGELLVRVDDEATMAALRGHDGVVVDPAWEVPPAPEGRIRDGPARWTACCRSPSPTSTAAREPRLLARTPSGQP